MKYFLDTNIILILFLGRYNELRKSVIDLLENTSNSFYASSVSLIEISQLYRKKKLKDIDYERLNTGERFIREILKKIPILKVRPYEEKHGLITGRLTFVPKHNDPNDLAIIAHAMGEKATLISTDGNFPLYEQQGAKIVYNPR